MSKLIDAARLTATEWENKINAIVEKYLDAVRSHNSDPDLSEQGRESKKRRAYEEAMKSLDSTLGQAKAELQETVELMARQADSAKRKYHNSIDQDHRAKVEVIKEELAAELIGRGPVDFARLAGDIVESNDPLRMEAARAMLPQLQGAFDRYYQGSGDKSTQARTVSYLSDLARSLNKNLLPPEVRVAEEGLEEASSLVGNLTAIASLRKKALTASAPRGQWPPEGYGGE